MVKSSTKQRIRQDVAFRLGHYVYKLIDPRDGRIFYIGKGSWGRVLAHQDLSGIIGTQSEASVSQVIKRINAIKLEGLSPVKIIVRHGLTSDEAYLIESVLIQEYDPPENVVSGRDTSLLGSANIEQLIRRYSPEVMSIDPAERVIAINVRESTRARDLYNAVRYAWKVSLVRASKATLIFAVTDGVCRAAYVPEGPWLPATRNNFPTLDCDIPNRFGFNGKEVTLELRTRYYGKQLPAEMLWKPGKSNPISYNYR